MYVMCKVQIGQFKDYALQTSDLSFVQQCMDWPYNLCIAHNMEHEVSMTTSPWIACVVQSLDCAQSTAQSVRVRVCVCVCICVCTCMYSVHV